MPHPTTCRALRSCASSGQQDFWWPQALWRGQSPTERQGALHWESSLIGGARCWGDTDTPTNVSGLRTSRLVALGFCCFWECHLKNPFRQGWQEVEVFWERLYGAGCFRYPGEMVC